MTQLPTLREHLVGAAAYIAFATAFPGLAYRARWTTRLRPRVLLIYIAANTLFLFGVRHFVLPFAKRQAEEHERLKVRLGREPTEAELAEHFGWDTAN